MTTSDILISILIALIVNLATPLIRRWLVSWFTQFKVKAGATGVRILNTRLRQLESSLTWYESKSDLRELLKWLLPKVFEQIVFLWLLLLLPYFMEVASGFWEIPEAIARGGLYGVVGLCTRYFVSFLVIMAMAQKAVFFSETKDVLTKQINKVNEKLGATNS
ncbi:hypothetical protein ACJJI4_04305 [Microbulbifer sp. TRSA002]|uniref:hypothetical protein n=1 Tax=Microbulbifer sp. TRSA002 TaxID=3243382 RepID=UPI004039D8F3